MESRERLLWACVPLLQRVVIRSLLRHGHTELDALSLATAKAYRSLPRGSGSPSCSPEMILFYLWQCVRPAWIPGASLELHGSGVLSASQASPTHKGELSSSGRSPTHCYPLPQTFPSCLGGEALLHQPTLILLLVRLGGLSPWNSICPFQGCGQPLGLLRLSLHTYTVSSLASLPLTCSLPGQLGKSTSRMR